MKKAIAGIGMLGVLALGWFVFLSPIIAASALRTAVAAGDGPGIVRVMDVDAVRENVLAQIETEAKNMNNPFAGMGLMVMGGIASEMLQPEIIAKITPEQRAQLENFFGGLPTQMELSRSFGLTRFMVTMTPSDGKGEPIGLVFAPSGLGWKMVDVELDWARLGQGQ